MCNDNCVDLENTEEHHDHACDHKWYPCHVAVLFKLDNKFKRFPDPVYARPVVPYLEFWSDHVPGCRVLE